MQLDSSESLSAATKGTLQCGLESVSCPKVEACPSAKLGVQQITSWCYLFTHSRRVPAVVEHLRRHFRVFVHTTIVYHKEKRKVVAKESPSVSGLVFVQGDSRQIAEELSKVYSSLHLVNDYSTRRVAVIPDAVMRPFMRVSEMDPTRIRILHNPFAHYGRGNTLLRVTSGPLAGLEGYLIRLNRDRNLVIQVGQLTVAIGGVHKETFVHVEEFVRERHRLETQSASSGPAQGKLSLLSPLQAQIEESFFVPLTRFDRVTLAAGLDRWTERAAIAAHYRRYDEASDIVLYLLEALGGRFPLTAEEWCGKEMSDLYHVRQDSEQLVDRLLSEPAVPKSLHEQVAVQKDSLCARYGFWHQ